MDDTSLSSLLPNAISAIACLFLFCGYFAIPKKTIGLKMIFVMSVSDFIFHISMIFLDSRYIFEMNPMQDEMDMQSTMTLNLTQKGILAFIGHLCSRFSLLWACNMALFLSKLLSMKEIACTQTYFRQRLGLLFVSAVIISVMYLFLYHMI